MGHDVTIPFENQRNRRRQRPWHMFVSWIFSCTFFLTHWLSDVDLLYSGWHFFIFLPKIVTKWWRGILQRPDISRYPLFELLISVILYIKQCIRTNPAMDHQLNHFFCMKSKTHVSWFHLNWHCGTYIDGYCIERRKL